MAEEGNDRETAVVVEVSVLLLLLRKADRPTILDAIRGTDMISYRTPVLFGITKRKSCSIPPGVNRLHVQYRGR